MSIIDSNNTNKNPLLEAALKYANHGWPVLPVHSRNGHACTCGKPNCRSSAKHPRTRRGVHDATTIQATIKEWWESFPIANIGVATGKVTVLDVDAKNDGLQSLAELEKQHGTLPKTPTVATGGGGKHFYFYKPDGVTINNRVAVAPGIDIRTDGGYGVAPPSIHASGNRYDWILGPETPVASMPNWLVELVTPKPSDDTKATTANQTPAPSVHNGNGLIFTVPQAKEDLTNHPGTPEGERNATLCRLVGVHLARREAIEDIQVKALEWSERCDPPLTDAEVIRTVNKLAGKHDSKTSVVVSTNNGDEIDVIPLPEPPPWPRIDPDAFFGLIGDIVYTIEPQTEADPVALLVSLLTFIGNNIGRTPYFQVEGSKHHVNLFATLVGQSAKGRKGVSEERALSLFDDHDPWKECNMTAGLSSGEGLIWAVRDPIEEVEAIKEHGEIVRYESVIKDPGVEDKRLMVVESEFAQVLRVLRREGNTLSPLIRQAWDKGTINSLTKNSRAKATDAHISILAHITQPELTKYLGDTDCFNGFANRFLWVLVKRSKLLPDGGQDLDLQPLRQRLVNALAEARKVTQMKRSPQASKLWREVYADLSQERHGLYGAVTARAEAQTLRLSMLYALLDGSPVIDVPHLKAALALWRYCDESASIIFAQEDAEIEDPLERALLMAIRDEPGINRRGLHKVTGGRYSARKIVMALAKLRDRHLICAEKTATGGRPSECWFPCYPSKKAEPPTQATKISLIQAHPAASTSSVMSLAGLFDAVNGIGGTLASDGEKVRIKAASELITAYLQSALEHHHDELLALLPSSKATVEVANDDPEVEKMTDDEFVAELEAALTPGSSSPRWADEHKELDELLSARSA